MSRDRTAGFQQDDFPSGQRVFLHRDGRQSDPAVQREHEDEGLSSWRDPFRHRLISGGSKGDGLASTRKELFAESDFSWCCS